MNLPATPVLLLMLRRAALAALLSFALSPPGAAGTTQRVSVPASEDEGDADSYEVSISGNGRFVAFRSDATNLVPGDTNGRADVFVRDRKKGTTTRVSVNSAGDEGNDDSARASVSQNGRFVAFESLASNLVTGDLNNERDIFVHDRKTGATTRVSDSGSEPSLSASGRFIAFGSDSADLVPNDTNGFRDIFVHDRKTGAMTRVSIDSTGGQANEASFDAYVSGNGRFVAFHSRASNLIEGDLNGKTDIFVHDRKRGITTRVSVDSEGGECNGSSVIPSLSRNGKLVAFQSDASNLVEGDLNGFSDVFVHDRKSGVTSRVSVDSAGREGSGGSFVGHISANGRYVAFGSQASNLVEGDTEGFPDVFLHRLKTGVTTRISVDSAGGETDNGSYNPSISGNGRFVAFESEASDLVTGDENSAFDACVHDRKL